MFCCTLLYVHSSFAIILMGKRKLVAMLSLSSCCFLMVVWFFLAVPWVCLLFVIVIVDLAVGRWPTINFSQYGICSSMVANSLPEDTYSTLH